MALFGTNAATAWGLALSRSLADLGIHVQNRMGEQRVLCPQCSHLRRKKRQRCLSVVRDKDGWAYNCWHCGFKGGLREDIGQRRGMGRPISQHPPSDFGAVLRRQRYYVVP